MSKSAIHVEGLCHSFDGRNVLRGVSFDVPPGGFTAIVGPSGGGKSSILRVLSGLLTPDEGTVEVHGSSAIDRSGLVAFMPQRDNLLPWKRVIDNAVLGAVIRGRNSAEAKNDARRLLGLFGLAGYERAWPSQLSGGMRQRLALLRTFLVGLDVLALDEPFGALDAITRRQLQTWLQDVLAADRRTALLVTHDVEEAVLLADEVLVLSRRPAEIVLRLPVPFDRPRGNQLVSDGAFVRCKAELLAALDACGGSDSK